MTIEQQEEVDKAFQKVVEQRNKDAANGRFWVNGIMKYLEGSDNAPKDADLLSKPPTLTWMVSPEEKERGLCGLNRLPKGCNIYRYTKGICMNCGHWKGEADLSPQDSKLPPTFILY